MYVLHEQREDDENPDISSYWVSVNDGGPYSPYYALEQRGKLYLYNIGDPTSGTEYMARFAHNRI